MRLLNSLCIFLLTLTGTWPCMSLAAEETVRITNGEWPPYYGEQLPGHGLSSRIVSEAFGLVGVPVEYQFMPWIRSLSEARSGEFDAAIGWHDSPENRKYFFTSDAIATTTFVFFHHRKQLFDWHTYEDLSEFKIALTRGYEYPADFLRLVQSNEINVEWVNRDELGFRMLLLGRIDAFPQDRVVGYTLMEEIFSAADIRQITHHQKPMVTADLHLQFSREVNRSPRLLELFNQGLRELKKSGRYGEIYAQQPAGLPNPGID